ncbi:hydrolase of the alpha/beta-hydrolase fold-like protein [Oleiphilus messinensis]|uniref:Hydrolase of the alpha/beta-hydrolase fold-like protein n=1 Tax=Oleiphilus messinensis TaxID=141451 RepID=A0A1Y0I6I5_9GAMM|nr:NAD(P)-dependent oxidoreductase [Oleiphilus messinensis]ARU55840.1 hydrolase of the alpha/beta-hydrolase fold-like protein [Oleiphilus messinensis]
MNSELSNSPVQTESLKGKTCFITGASRGIGREIALKLAAEGANLVLAAKSAEPHPKLPGTIFSVAEEVTRAGGQALPLQLNVQDEAQIKECIDQAADHFGSLDILINNAGAIKLQGVEKLPVKRFDLMYQVNTRAVMAASQAALPWLKASGHAHILNLSPPLNLDPAWFANYAPYTITKYGMSMLTIGMAKEFKKFNISVNSLWPKTIIATAAVEFEAGNPALMKGARTPAIMADAAIRLLSTIPGAISGQTLVDEDWLRSCGQDNFDAYKNDPDYTGKLFPDLYV